MSSEAGEYLVGAKRLKSVPVAKAKKKKGFFDHHRSIARLTDSDWDDTVERLMKLWQGA